MSLKEKLMTFVLSEEGAISKSAVLGIGAVLSIVAVAAMPGPAEAANCSCDCPEPACQSWHQLYECSDPHQGCYLWYRYCTCEADPNCTMYALECGFA